MAGHSKWKQIKHRKAAADAKKSNVFGKMARAISAAVRAAQGNVNAPAVTAIVERAKRVDMPKENIERALARGSNTDEAALDTLLFEAFAPGGIALLIVSITDSRNRTVQEIKHLLSEYDIPLGSAGSSAWAFNKTPEGYEALSPTQPDTETKEALAALLADLEAHDDVQAVYTSALLS
jgi:transcriptional/translational regulatory protein YebC/TACO1